MLNVMGIEVSNAKDAVSVLESHVEEIPQPRDLSNMKVGEAAHQGDVIVIRVDKVKNVGAVASRQLAPGMSVGSNHRVPDVPGVGIFSHKDPLPYRFSEAQRGPCVISDKPWSLLHPKHGDMVNFPAGDYIVLYQIDSRTLQRVND